MLQTRMVTLVVTVAALTACSAADRALTAPAPGPARAGLSLASSGVEQSVTGHANIVLDYFNNAIERYSQSAIRHADGSFSGEFELSSQQAGSLRIHGDVVCFHIVGNTAYLAGIVDQSNYEGVTPGSYVVWNVIDNGEGANDPPDLTSDFWEVSPEGATFQCTQGIEFFTLPVVSGNLQVHP